MKRCAPILKCEWCGKDFKLRHHTHRICQPCTSKGISAIDVERRYFGRKP